MSIYYVDQEAEPILKAGFNIEKADPSLSDSQEPSLCAKRGLNQDDFRRLFLSKYDLDYICDYNFTNSPGLRIVTHPGETSTCFEKAEILDSWDPLNVIKVFYLECSKSNLLYAVVVPETGCFTDRMQLKRMLKLPDDAFLKKADRLPANMSFGTCSPFVLEKDCVTNGGCVDKIVFDTETLSMKKEERMLDDFSFGLDHRMSIQMNYYDCFMLLKQRYPDTVVEDEFMNLSFKEKLIRNKGRIKIAYEFSSLNYRTAKFINSIHGFGDVSIINDYIDELNLPDVLTESNMG